jgi:uncharacterized protein YecE (DUF72 family)
MAGLQGKIRIGTAGWSIPPQHKQRFRGDGTHLERYARRFSCVEINSSFYRPHRPQTYARWAESVPAGFRFAVKMPREITHRRKLVDIAEPLARFLGEASALGDKLGPILVQLPPSLRYVDDNVRAFLGALRAQFMGAVVCEPRHATWFTDPVDTTLSEFNVARAAADPALVPRAARPGGWLGLTYRRLHGSPDMYYSAYAEAAIDTTAEAMREETAECRETWCVFDNTARGEATGNALSLQARLLSPVRTALAS